MIADDWCISRSMVHKIRDQFLRYELVWKLPIPEMCAPEMFTETVK